MAARDSRSKCPIRSYDAKAGRLIYLTGQATPDEWDDRWGRANLEQLLTGNRNGWLVAQTRRYLPSNSRVLEGGCGCADKVKSLTDAGYFAIGFDTATGTLRRAKSVCPDLALGVADIRHLPFADSVIDAYWSLGVFEHFLDGMVPQWQEASRILRKDGILFLTLPIISPLRRFKASLGLYPAAGSVAAGDFYQYAYSPEEVRRLAKDAGFALRHSSYLDGVKGLKDEIPLLRPLLQRIYGSRSVVARVVIRALDISLRRIAGHLGYFVFQRR
jgi:SAM-dependent methyltransferase